MLYTAKSSKANNNELNTIIKVDDNTFAHPVSRDELQNEKEGYLKTNYQILKYVTKPIFIYGKKTTVVTYIGSKRIDIIEKASILGLKGIPFYLIVNFDDKSLVIDIFKEDNAKIKAKIHPFCIKFNDPNLTFSLKTKISCEIPDSAIITLWITTS